MKAIFVFIFVTTAVTLSNAQAPAFDGEHYVPSYSLATPTNWGVERIAFPIEFAPTIPYKGVEDLRFTPGWGEAKSSEYWTYSFLWFLEGKPDITPEATEKNLEAYYTGLIGRNIERRKIPAEKIFPTKVTMKKISAEAGDLQTYSGTINMLDYMEQKPITLNCLFHVKLCPGRDNTFVFCQISPQPMTKDTWKELRNLWTSFGCDPTK